MPPLNNNMSLAHERAYAQHHDDLVWAHFNQLKNTVACLNRLGFDTESIQDLTDDAINDVCQTKLSRYLDEYGQKFPPPPVPATPPYGPDHVQRGGKGKVPRMLNPDAPADGNPPKPGSPKTPPPDDDPPEDGSTVHPVTWKPANRQFGHPPKPGSPKTPPPDDDPPEDRSPPKPGSPKVLTPDDDAVDMTTEDGSIIRLVPWKPVIREFGWGSNPGSPTPQMPVPPEDAVIVQRADGAWRVFVRQEGEVRPILGPTDHEEDDCSCDCDEHSDWTADEDEIHDYQRPFPTRFGGGDKGPAPWPPKPKLELSRAAYTFGGEPVTVSGPRHPMRSVTYPFPGAQQFGKGPPSPDLPTIPEKKQRRGLHHYRGGSYAHTPVEQYGNDPMAYYQPEQHYPRGPRLTQAAIKPAPGKELNQPGPVPGPGKPRRDAAGPDPDREGPGCYPRTPQPNNPNGPSQRAHDTVHRLSLIRRQLAGPGRGGNPDVQNYPPPTNSSQGPNRRPVTQPQRDSGTAPPPPMGNPSVRKPPPGPNKPVKNTAQRQQVQQQGRGYGQQVGQYLSPNDVITAPSRPRPDGPTPAPPCPPLPPFFPPMEEGEGVAFHEPSPVPRPDGPAPTAPFPPGPLPPYFPPTLGEGVAIHELSSMPPLVPVAPLPEFPFHFPPDNLEVVDSLGPHPTKPKPEQQEQEQPVNPDMSTVEGQTLRKLPSTRPKHLSTIPNPEAQDALHLEEYRPRSAAYSNRQGSTRRRERRGTYPAQEQQAEGDQWEITSPALTVY